MLIGAVIGLLLISVFLLGVNHPRPEWGPWWMVRPLIIVPLAGAMGGAFYAFIHQQDLQPRWVKTTAVVFSVFVFLVGLWLGTVLGLSGTLWH